MDYINEKQHQGVYKLATYRITYTDTRFDDLSQNERMFKIKDLFEEGKLHLDTDKRVRMLNVVPIYKDELESTLSTHFHEWFEDLSNASQIYEHSTDGDYGSADELLLDAVFVMLKDRANRSSII